MAERNNYIDFLRFIGITLIVLAHIGAPYTITQIRTFDVPLMMFVSGLSFSGKAITPSWRKFYWPRVKRILIPVYVFLTFYFVIFAILKLPLSWSLIWNSYMLTTDNSIGFVWIMRVFLLIMLVTPLWSNVVIKRFKSWQVYLLISLLFILECVLVYISKQSEKSFIFTIYNETIPYLAGYSIFFLLGLRLRNVEKKEETVFLCVVSFIAIVSEIIYVKQNGFPLNISAFKYPPTTIFIVYGALASVFLWFARTVFSPLANNKIVLFVGRNTIWIYLWHILFVIASFKLFSCWVIRYFFVYCGAVAVFTIQYFMVTQLKNKYNWLWLKYFWG